jgi:uncharacterized protein
MKESIYNIVIPLSKKYALLYNSFSNKYLIISKHLNETLKNKECDIKDKYPLFYLQLIEIGYIVEKDNDEILLLKTRINEIDNDDKKYMLIINPTINCNFKCWYCYEKHIPKSKMNAETLDRVKLFITHVTNRDSIHTFDLSFFGGEPLLYFSDVVVPIIKHYKDCCFQHQIKTSISFTTNGYLLDDLKICELKKIGANFFQITLDGSRSDHDNTRFVSKRKGSYDRIIRNIKQLAENQLDVLIRINYTVHNIEKVIEIGNDLIDILPENKKFVSINFQRVWQDERTNEELENKIKNLIDDYLELFSQMGFKTSTKILNYVWDSCYADKKNQILINYNGDLYKCTARDFNEANKIGYLSSSGDLVLEQEKVNIRRNIRFTNPVCYDCKIAPLCGGGCNQRHLERIRQNSCLMGYSEKDKEMIIIDHFYNTITSKK